MTLASRYVERFVQHAVSLIALGFEDVKISINESTDEEVITDRITRAANARLRSGNVSSPLRRLAISDNSHVSDNEREGKHRRRIDVRVESVSIAGRPTLEVEAKCLRGLTHSINKYIGKDGLQLFLNGEYAREHAFGAMLGYVQSNDISYWSDKLVSKIGNDCALIGDCEALKDYAISHGYRSNHSRQNLSDIAIHHFFLKCTDIDSASCFDAASDSKI